jgi:hypothetical protein
MLAQKNGGSIFSQTETVVTLKGKRKEPYPGSPLEAYGDDN